MQIIINQFENSSKIFENQEATDMVYQIKIDQQKIEQISQENEFFAYLYRSINELITEQGQTPEAF